MSTLALDLGTSTGYALLHPTGLTISGTWKFQPKRHEDAGMRYRRFVQQLDQLHKDYAIKTVYFEEVRRHAGTTAAHVYGGFMAFLLTWCGDNQVSYQSVPVGEIKKSFTGKGNAPKELMIEEARRRGYEPVDDNEADALAILVLKTEGTT